jgi:uncharacterized protein YunC (DUF1805 family)
MDFLVLSFRNKHGYIDCGALDILQNQATSSNANSRGIFMAHFIPIR